MPELDAKIAACDRELAQLKTALARTKPAAQGSLKQKALSVLKRKKMYEAQRGSVQTRAFNLEQTQFALESVKGAQDHVAVRRRRCSAAGRRCGVRARTGRGSILLRGSSRGRCRNRGRARTTATQSAETRTPIAPLSLGSTLACRRSRLACRS